MKLSQKTWFMSMNAANYLTGIHSILKELTINERIPIIERQQEIINKAIEFINKITRPLKTKEAYRPVF